MRKRRERALTRGVSGSVAMDEQYELVVKSFFEADSLATSLAVLCESCKHAQDPISATVLIVLTCPVQIQLTAVGWQPFKGKDLIFPYNMMSDAQRQVFRGFFEPPGAWRTYEHAIILKRSAPPVTLKPLDVLGALCSVILSSTAYKDRRHRVAICNILLQRVQASVPLDKGTQAQLNARLFGPQKEVIE